MFLALSAVFQKLPKIHQTLFQITFHASILLTLAPSFGKSFSRNPAKHFGSPYCFFPQKTGQYYDTESTDFYETNHFTRRTSLKAQKSGKKAK